MMGNMHNNHLEMSPAMSLSAYNKVQPFDSHFLLNILSNEHVNSDDFKFISWKDFDIALESDHELFKKLIELETRELDDRLNADNFVPMTMVGLDGGRNYLKNNDPNMYYRANRAEKSHKSSELNKEKVEYQM